MLLDETTDRTVRILEAVLATYDLLQGWRAAGIVAVSAWAQGKRTAPLGRARDRSLVEASRAEIGARQDGSVLIPPAVDCSALQTLREVRIGTLFEGHETVNRVLLCGVEEELRVTQRVPQVECTDE